jgi:TRAP-type C4-dicarboxylate transport system substrate-binding protein
MNEMNTITRRSFLKNSITYGAGMSIMNSFPIAFNLACADSPKEEQNKENHAKYIFNFSSPYFTKNFMTTPHAHHEIKRLIEKYTMNKVYVKIHDGGVNGIGTSLANSVKYGLSQGALISASNLAPMIPEIDILNIPFWSSGENEYTRLFNSEAWDKHVLSKMQHYNIKVLFPYVVGARTATSTKIYGKLIKRPADFENVRFRIPGSKSLAVFYKLAKAKPQNIAWKLCARTARRGRYDALDPSVIGLFAGPEELNKELGTISEIELVHDGWVAIGNTHFIDSLDSQTKKQFFDALEEIQVLQVKNYHKAKNYCSEEFKKLNVKIYTPTSAEKEVLAKSFGHTNPSWVTVKKRLLGNDNGLSIFDDLFKIAKG